MVIFSLEVVLYWIDGFKRYWCSGTKIFDFFITVMCFIPTICKEHLKSLLANYPSYSQEIKNIKECPYVVFDGNLVDVSNAVGSSAWGQLLFTVYHSHKRTVEGKSTSFIVLQIEFSRQKVQDIAAAIVKAMKALTIIMILFVVFIVLFGLMIYTLFRQDF